MNAPLSSIIAVVALGIATLLPIATGFAQDTQDAAKPAQSAVAAKDKKFALVKPEADAVKKAIHASDLLAFKDKTGKEITITGKVYSVFAPKSHSIVLLNFATNYKDAITVAIKAKDFANFPDLRKLKDKQVVVTGKCIDYKGQPELEISLLKQLHVIE
jgi:bisphosphoglycerate-independent phosphoglycerate mutase (AlkP superfamily)